MAEMLGEDGFNEFLDRMRGGAQGEARRKQIMSVVIDGDHAVLEVRNKANTVPEQHLDRTKGGLESRHTTVTSGMPLARGYALDVGTCGETKSTRPIDRKRFELFHRQTLPFLRFFARRLFPARCLGVVPAEIGGKIIL
jgi:hypothetical protein